MSRTGYKYRTKRCKRCGNIYRTPMKYSKICYDCYYRDERFEDKMKKVNDNAKH